MSWKKEVLSWSCWRWKHLGHPKNFTVGVKKKVPYKNCRFWTAQPFWTVLYDYGEFWTVLGHWDQKRSRRVHDIPKWSKWSSWPTNNWNFRKKGTFFLGQPAVSRLNTFPRCSNTLALKKFPKNRSVKILLLVFPILLPTECCASVTYIEVGPTILWKCDLYLYIEVGSHHSPRPTLLPSHVGTTNCDNYVRLGENLLDVFF